MLRICWTESTKHEREKRTNLRGALPTALLSGLLLSTWLLHPPGAVSQDRKTAAKKAEKKDPFLDPASGPLTLPRMISLLDQIKQDVETEGRIILGVQARGVDFPMSPENTEQLKNAGASDRLLEIVREKALAPPSTRPQAEPTGTVTVQCAPVECEISLQGSPYVGTENGVRTFSGVKRGTLTVDARKTGYYSQQKEVVITGEVNRPVEFSFLPDNTTQSEFGSRLLKGMLDVLGGDAGRKDLREFSGTGSIASWDPAGAQSDWNLTASLRSNLTTFEAKNSAGSLKLECRGEKCDARLGGGILGKKLKTEQAQSLEANLRQFRINHLAVLLDRILAPNMHPSAASAEIPAKGEQHFRQQTASEAYEIVLNDQMLPGLVTFESKTGAGSGLRLAFSDYATYGASRFPRTTEIKLPDGKQGLRIHFNELGSEKTAK